MHVEDRLLKCVQRRYLNQGKGVELAFNINYQTQQEYGQTVFPSIYKKTCWNERFLPPEAYAVEMEKMEGGLKDFCFLLGQKVLSEIKKENEGSGEALGCFEFLFEHKWTRGDPVIWRRDFLGLLRSINASEDVEVGAKSEFVRGMIEKCGRKTIRSNQVAYQVSTIYDSFLGKLQKRLRSIIPTIYDQVFLLQLQVARKGCEYWDTKFGNIGYN